MRMQTDKDCPPPTLDEPPPYSIGVMAGMALIMALLLACGVWSVAQSAVLGQWRVQLIRGSTTVGQGVGDTEDAAWADCESKIPRNATAATVYACQTMRYYATVSPDPVCPPKPGNAQRLQDCSAPTVGTWVQDQIFTPAPFPTCWILGEWTPPVPPAGMCAPPVANRAPTIAGSAPATGTVGQLYAFTPTAADPDGDPLTFAIVARPPWTGWTFDAATGRMTGTPSTVRTHPGISITVSDGRGGTAELRLPTITISSAVPSPVTRGTAALSWTHDGANVTGFRVVYGTSPTALAQTVQINSETARNTNVTGLTPGTYYFAVKAFNAVWESVSSNVISKVIAP